MMGGSDGRRRVGGRDGGAQVEEAPEEANATWASGTAQTKTLAAAFRNIVPFGLLPSRSIGHSVFRQANHYHTFVDTYRHSLGRLSCVHCSIQAHLQASSFQPTESKYAWTIQTPTPVGFNRNQSREPIVGKAAGNVHHDATRCKRK